MKAVLTVAGSDPSSGAGLQADIRVFHNLGLHPLSVVTSITVQNSLGVKDVFPLEPSLVIRQLQALLEDFSVEWMKTGILGNTETVEAIAKLIEETNIKVVVDPIIISTSGFPLCNNSAREAMKELLIPKAAAITPNIPEAEMLTGIKFQPQLSDEFYNALLSLGAKWIILKGGHFQGKIAEDILIQKTSIERFSSEKVEGVFHGTGCVFSAALTGYLALGYDIKNALINAKKYINKAIKEAYNPAKGMAYLRI